MGQEAGVHEVRRSQKWTAAAKLQPTILTPDRLLARLGIFQAHCTACGFLRHERDDGFLVAERELARLARHGDQAELLVGVTAGGAHKDAFSRLQLARCQATGTERV